MRHRISQGTRDVTRFLYLERREGAARLPCTGLSRRCDESRAWYLRSDQYAPVALTLVPVAGGAPHVEGGFREVDATHMPGVYELMLPDALLAHGARSAVVMLRFRGVRPYVSWIDLVGYEPYDDFAIGLGNFARPVCHEHLSGIFYQLMPSAVRALIEART